MYTYTFRRSACAAYTMRCAVSSVNAECVYDVPDHDDCHTRTFRLRLVITKSNHFAPCAVFQIGIPMVHNGMVNRMVTQTEQTQVTAQRSPVPTSLLSSVTGVRCARSRTKAAPFCVFAPSVARV